MKQWKSAGAYVQGRSHLKNNIPCQDSIYSISNWNLSVISLADGAGSCKHSKDGAEISSRIVCKIFNKYFNKLYNAPIEKIKNVVIENILRFISFKAKELNASVEDFSSTLLFIAIKGQKYITGHIGDGVIGQLTDSNIEVFSFPDNNEYANCTYFTTSNNVLEHFRITKGKLNNIKGFVLMSDGSAESLYDKKNKRLSIVSKQILEWLNNNDSNTVSEAIQQNIQAFFIPKTMDDCSINLLKMIENKKNAKQKKVLIQYLLTKIKNLFN